MQAWVYGLGNLAQLIAPIHENGDLKPIGTKLVGKHLQVAWFSGSNALEPVIELPSDWMTPHVSAQREWLYGRSAYPGNESVWAWKWALNTLTSNLAQKLEWTIPCLKVESKPLHSEAAWRAALALIKYGKTDTYRNYRWWGPNNIPLNEIDDLLTHIEEEADRRRWITLPDIGSRSWQKQIYYLKHLRQEINQLKELNVMVIDSPWVGPDLTEGKYMWELYSHKQLLLRIRSVYEAALNAYQKIAEIWFPKRKDSGVYAAKGVSSSTEV